MIVRTPGRDLDRRRRQDRQAKRHVQPPLFHRHTQVAFDRAACISIAAGTVAALLAAPHADNPVFPAMATGQRVSCRLFAVGPGHLHAPVRAKDRTQGLGRLRAERSHLRNVVRLDLCCTVGVKDLVGGACRSMLGLESFQGLRFLFGDRGRRVDADALGSANIAHETQHVGFLGEIDREAYLIPCNARPWRSPPRP